jgi:hypothetical protein
MGLSPKDYSSHSLRIGGACALLAAGKSDLFIRLMDPPMGHRDCCHRQQFCSQIRQCYSPLCPR